MIEMNQGNDMTVWMVLRIMIAVPAINDRQRRLHDRCESWLRLMSDCGWITVSGDKKWLWTMNVTRWLGMITDWSVLHGCNWYLCMVPDWRLQMTSVNDDRDWWAPLTVKNDGVDLSMWLPCVCVRVWLRVDSNVFTHSATINVFVKGLILTVWMMTVNVLCEWCRERWLWK
jgi:hypothetical protein